ncbi:MAG: GHKL domain-containing protein [Clostridiales bacterium]|nr:GHKL domain-containing protein [Clostridiales bacterium]
MTFLTAFVFEILSSFPYLWLDYYPFRSEFRFPRWIVALFVTGTLLLYCFSFAILTTQGYGTIARMTEFIAAFFSLLLFLVSIKADPWKLLFLYIFNLDYLTMVCGTTFYVESLLFYSPNLNFVSPRSIVIAFVLLCLTTPPMLLFLRKMKERVFETDAPAFWRVVWVMPLFITIIVLLYTSDLSPENVQQFRFFFSRVLMMVGMFAFFYVLLYTFDMIRRETEMRERAAQQEYLLALQRTQYNQISRHMEETRRARHDLSHHLKVVNGFLAADDLDGLRKYMASYEQMQPPNTVRSYCKNYAVNTIVSYYAEEAEKAGIDFTVGMDMPMSLPVDESDLCSILGNLLENALTACQKIGQTKAAYIHVLARTKGSFVDLAVDNSCLIEPVMKNGRFLSTHHDGYGVGTVSVRSIAKRYHGSVQFHFEDQVFYASVTLSGR